MTKDEKTTLWHLVPSWQTEQWNDGEQGKITTDSDSDENQSTTGI